MGANGLVALGRDRSGAWSGPIAPSPSTPTTPMLLYNIACIRSMAGAARRRPSTASSGRSRAGLRNRGWLEHDSNLDAIRSHPRFQALMRSLEPGPTAAS